MIYLVKEGEFEQVTNIDNEKKDIFGYNSFGVSMKPKAFKDGSHRSFQKRAQAIKTESSKLNRGMLIGDEDSLQSKWYTKSVRCKSIKGELLGISAVNFVQFVNQCKKA